MCKIGYIRVSTEHQETARQQEIMCDYQVDRIFSEKISGAKGSPLGQFPSFIRNEQSRS